MLGLRSVEAYAAVAEPRRVGAMVRSAGISDFGRLVAHIVVPDPHTVELHLAGELDLRHFGLTDRPQRIDRQIGLTVRALLVQTQP